MLSFRNIQLEDRERVARILRAERGRGCEYTFGNILIWREVYQTEIAFVGDEGCVVYFGSATSAYLFPTGTGNRKTVIEEMMADAARRGTPFKIIAAGPEDIKALEALFPGRFSWHASRDYAEYVYNSDDLICLPGKKYHGKRNHIAHFTKTYPDYRFEEITPDNLAEVSAMNEAWYESYQPDDGDDGLEQEKRAAENAFRYFFELGFSGGLLRVDDEVIAFAAGEPINPQTFCVHLEKASHRIDGAYAVINRDFARHFCQQYHWINREDDVGREGLRRAKLSYHPAEITEKYVVTER